MEHDERAHLQALTMSSDARLSLRAKLVLMSIDGCSAEQISADACVAPVTVYKWRARYRALGIAGLRDLPRPGQPRKLNAERVLEVVNFARERLPEKAARWSVRSLARVLRITEHQVRSVLAKHDLRPHQDQGLPPLERADQAGCSVRLQALLLAPPFSAAFLRTHACPAGEGAASAATTNVRKPDAAPGPLHRAYAASQSPAGARAPARHHATVLVRAIERFGGEGVEQDVLLCCPLALEHAVVTALGERPWLHVHVSPLACHWTSELDRLLRLEDARTKKSVDHEMMRGLREQLQRFAADNSANGETFLWNAVSTRPTADQRNRRAPEKIVDIEATRQRA